jgi:galactokinase
LTSQIQLKSSVRYALACRNLKHIGHVFTQNLPRAWTRQSYRRAHRLQRWLCNAAAINFSTRITLYPLNDRRLEFFSENFSDEAAIDLDNPPNEARGDWSDYPIGVAVMLMRAGHKLKGGRFVIKGEVPIGSGLSSSAALEVATAIAITANSDLQIERAELARICRQAENEFVGAHVGVMDQFVSLFGEADKALLLDCRSLAFAYCLFQTKLS